MKRESKEVTWSLLFIVVSDLPYLSLFDPLL